MKHTKGPWKKYQVGLDKDNYCICTEKEFRKEKSPILRTEIAEYITKYDACLIAAAPELLEALKDSQNKIIQLCETVNTLCPGKIHTIDFVELASEAIAKAEGKRK
jgi:hypothetical protein